jgi:putative transposase
MLIKALALIFYVIFYNTAGTVGIQACGVPSGGVTTSYGVIASYGSMKQEAQSSLAIG